MWVLWKYGCPTFDVWLEFLRPHMPCSGKPISLHAVCIHTTKGRRAAIVAVVLNFPGNMTWTTVQFFHPLVWWCQTIWTMDHGCGFYVGPNGMFRTWYFHARKGHAETTAPSECVPLVCEISVQHSQREFSLLSRSLPYAGGPGPYASCVQGEENLCAWSCCKRVVENAGASETGWCVRANQKNSVSDYKIWLEISFWGWQLEKWQGLPSAFWLIGCQATSCHVGLPVGKNQG